LDHSRVVISGTACEISIKDFNAAIQDEIARVKKLATGTFTGVTRDKSVYKNDKVKWLQGVGKGLETKLNEGGIFKVSDLLTLDEVQQQQLAIKTGITVTKISQLTKLDSGDEWMQKSKNQSKAKSESQIWSLS
jgi:predicted flap endonuclease-1-like 5' DNA nuclease